MSMGIYEYINDQKLCIYEYINDQKLCIYIFIIAHLSGVSPTTPIFPHSHSHTPTLPHHTPTPHFYTPTPYSHTPTLGLGNIFIYCLVPVWECRSMVWEYRSVVWECGVGVLECGSESVEVWEWWGVLGPKSPWNKVSLEQ